jgi:hypothetical protein
MKWVMTEDEWKKRKNEASQIQNAMKQAQGVKVPPPKPPTEEDKKSYEFLGKESAFMEGFQLWVAYPLEKMYSRDFQRRYEAFCGGWLHFWDKNISMEVRERLLYIKWDEKKNVVLLYISKEAERKGYRITLTVEGPGDPPVVPPPPPPGDNN